MTQQTMVKPMVRQGASHGHPAGSIAGAVLEHAAAGSGASGLGLPGNEPLLREALGATLKEFRAQSGFTLRELAKMSSVSPGYLSELERGRKEVSSELLASVCHAMGVSVATVMIEAASMMALDAAAAELTASMRDEDYSLAARIARKRCDVAR